MCSVIQQILEITNPNDSASLTHSMSRNMPTVDLDSSAELKQESAAEGALALPDHPKLEEQASPSTPCGALACQAPPSPAVEAPFVPVLEGSVGEEREVLETLVAAATACKAVRNQLSAAGGHSSTVHAGARSPSHSPSPPRAPREAAAGKLVHPKRSRPTPGTLGYATFGEDLGRASTSEDASLPLLPPTHAAGLSVAALRKAAQSIAISGSGPKRRTLQPLFRSTPHTPNTAAALVRNAAGEVLCTHEVVAPPSRTAPTPAASTSLLTPREDLWPRSPQLPSGSLVGQMQQPLTVHQMAGLSPAERAAIGAQLQAQQLLMYAEFQLQHARSGAASRAARRAPFPKTAREIGDPFATAAEAGPSFDPLLLGRPLTHR